MCLNIKQDLGMRLFFGARRQMLCLLNHLNVHVRTHERSMYNVNVVVHVDYCYFR